MTASDPRLPTDPIRVEKPEAPRDVEARYPFIGGGSASGFSMHCQSGAHVFYLGAARCQCGQKIREAVASETRIPDNPFASRWYCETCDERRSVRLRWLAANGDQHVICTVCNHVIAQFECAGDPSAGDRLSRLVEYRKASAGDMEPEPMGRGRVRLDPLPEGGSDTIRVGTSMGRPINVPVGDPLAGGGGTPPRDWTLRNTNEATNSRRASLSSREPEPPPHSADECVDVGMCPVCREAAGVPLGDGDAPPTYEELAITLLGNAFAKPAESSSSVSLGSLAARPRIAALLPSPQTTSSTTPEKT